MALIVAEAPAFNTLPFDELLGRIAQFNQLHEHGVLRDFGAADKYYARHPQLTSNGKTMSLTLIVTPKSFAYRPIEKSFVQEDFKSPGCEHHVWLRDLYRTNCPVGMRVEFGRSVHSKAIPNSSPKGAFMLEVSFIKSKPTDGRSRRS